MSHPISLFDAIVLGCVEGLTEFLPVSSTGHLILTTRLLGLDDPTFVPPVQAGINAFNIVIQSGALLAVIGLYRLHVWRMLRGALGRDAAGRDLLLKLCIGFLPAAVAGVLFDNLIDAYLMGTGPWGYWPVIGAIFFGGIAMIGVELWRNRFIARRGEADALLRVDLETPGRRFGHLSLEQMTWQAALLIGMAQCVAMWPGTSRSMMTIVAALLLGFSPAAAAEFSFLLALPTLGGATTLKLAKHHAELGLAAGGTGLAVGFLLSCVVAWLAVKGFVLFVNRRGLTPFGIYRLVLGIVVGCYFYL